MKKYLPVIIFVVLILAPFFVPSIAHAQTSPAPKWVEDPEVTFVGKAGARAGAFLDWTISTYQWAQGASNLAAFWVTIRNIVYGFLILLVLSAAFVIIVTRGKSLTVQRFIPRFIGIVVLVIFSFSIIQVIYQIADVIQVFFLRNSGGAFISQRDLLNIGFDYQNFVGYRLSGSANDESAFMALFLVKLTTITYYVMSAVLILRKIILWFFIIISPIFPLLILYAPIRNTAKIWMGEFFRWLLYAPLFAVFLSGLVSIWKSNGIPLNFHITSGTVVYPTAINILLAGPGQTLGAQNSVNAPQTFALYVVALIMLWVVILLPFLLLQIFLDYLHNFQPSENAVIRQLLTMGSGVLKRPPVIIPPPAPSVAPTGMAKPLPFGAAKAIPLQQSSEISTQSQTNVNRPVTTNINRPITVSRPVTTINQVTSSILRTTNMNVPTMRDIARIETNTVTNTHTEEVTHVARALEQIANPRASENPVQREQYRVVRDQLIQQKQKGDPVAASVLQAATVVSEAKTNAPASISHAAPAFPVVNRVQNVSLEDYESVKKLWEQNYTKLEPPKSLSGQQDRKEWVQEDLQKVTEAINKLQSHDPKAVKEAMGMISSILPFLLIGGFSQTEILAYLKAKQEAAKTSLEKLEARKEGESTMVDRDEGVKHEEASMTMHAQAEAPEEKPLKELDDTPKIGQDDNKQ